ncbi:MAG: hypothetical protein R3B82_21120 [Sandaracinaceae bacterium]
MAFSPCSECARHVRVEDEACPFCGSVATRPAPKIPRRSATRVTRAALFFAGVLGASACDSGTAEPVYGGPPTSQGDEDDPGMADIYGGPPLEDEPADDEADEATDDAPEADEAMPVEAYGAPAPPPDGE